MKRNRGIFNETALLMTESGFTIVSENAQQPWGGFFVIDENQSASFAANFFPEKALAGK